jgi:hypothetical protein
MIPAVTQVAALAGSCWHTAKLVDVQPPFLSRHTQTLRITLLLLIMLPLLAALSIPSNASVIDAFDVVDVCLSEAESTTLGGAGSMYTFADGDLVGRAVIPEGPCAGTKLGPVRSPPPMVGGCLHAGAVDDGFV